MENKNKQKPNLKLSYELASVWFGAHVGPGFATGAMLCMYFTSCGWNALWMPIVTMALEGIVFYSAMEMARTHKAFTYRKVVDAIFHPFHKVLGPLIDFITCWTGFLGLGVTFAACGSSLNSLFGWPKMIGNILMAVASVLIALYGQKLVRKVSGGLSICLLAVLSITCIVTIVSQWDTIAGYISSRYVPEGIDGKQIFMFIILYCAFCSGHSNHVVACSDAISNEKESRWAAVFGTLMNGCMMTLIVLSMLAYIPDVFGMDSPFVYTLGQTFPSGVTIIYAVFLNLALISSGVTIVFGLAKRAQEWVPQSVKKESTRLLIPSVLFSVAGILVSSMGLYGIFSGPFKYNNYVYIFILVIPYIFIAPFRYRRKQKELDEQSLAKEPDGQIQQN